MNCVCIAVGIVLVSSLKNCSWHFIAVDANAAMAGLSVKSDTPNITAVVNIYKRTDYPSAHTCLLPDPRHFSRSVHQVQSQCCPVLRAVTIQTWTEVKQKTNTRRLTTLIRSEKCVVGRFRRCANAIECASTNLVRTV